MIDKGLSKDKADKGLGFRQGKARQDRQDMIDKGPSKDKAIQDKIGKGTASVQEEQRKTHRRG